MKTITLKVEDCDQVIIDELKDSYHMFNQLDKADCVEMEDENMPWHTLVSDDWDDVIKPDKPDYGLLKAIQTVLEYYMPHDDWLEWVEKNPILVTKL